MQSVQQLAQSNAKYFGGTIAAIEPINLYQTFT